jgi:hypothetical protein
VNLVRILELALVLAGAGTASSSAEQAAITGNARVDRLLEQMTLDEKIAMLHGTGEAAATYRGESGYLPGVPRFGSPPMRGEDPFQTGEFNKPHPEKEIASLECDVGIARTRWLVLAVTLSSEPVFFAPYYDCSTGTPDGWNGSIIYALVEGLAGIKERGAAFSRTELTPRWHSPDVPSAEVTVRYSSSTGYCFYQYRARECRLEFEFTDSAETFDVQLLLPPIVCARQARLDGHEIQTTLRRIGDSTCLVLTPIQLGVHRVEVDLAQE